MAVRIALDSERWIPSQDTHQDLNLSERIQQLLGNASANPEAANSLLADLWLVDYPIKQFHYMVPYFLDLFEKHSQEYHDSIATFCHCLTRAFDGDPGRDQECRSQIEDNKSRISSLLLRSLDYSEKMGFKDVNNFQYFLAGISAIHGYPELGEQITRLEF